MNGVQNLQKLFQRLGAVDLKRIQKLKDRMGKVDEKEREVIRKEIADEEEKLRLEKGISDLEIRLTRGMASFNQALTGAVSQLRTSAYPYDAKGHVYQARTVLSEILGITKETRALEEKLMELGKTEKKLLKKERDAA